MDGQTPPQGPAHPGAIHPGAPQPGQPAAPSGAPKVFGILSIIFSSWILLLNLPLAFGGVVGSKISQMGEIANMSGQLSGKAKDLPPEIVARILDVVGTLYSVMAFQGFLLMAMSGVLLGIGVGQVKYRKWAADWSVYWGAAGILAVVVMIGMLVFVVGPAYEDMFGLIAEIDPDDAAVGVMLGVMIGGWVGFAIAIVYVPYPLLLLIFFRKENVRAVMVN